MRAKCLGASVFDAYEDRAENPTGPFRVSFCPSGFEDWTSRAPLCHSNEPANFIRDAPGHQLCMILQTCTTLTTYVCLASLCPSGWLLFRSEKSKAPSSTTSQQGQALHPAGSDLPRGHLRLRGFALRERGRAPARPARTPFEQRHG